MGSRSTLRAWEGVQIELLCPQMLSAIAVTLELSPLMEIFGVNHSLTRRTRLECGSFVMRIWERWRMIIWRSMAGALQRDVYLLETISTTSLQKDLLDGQQLSTSDPSRRLIH